MKFLERILKRDPMKRLKSEFLKEAMGEDIYIGDFSLDGRLFRISVDASPYSSCVAFNFCEIENLPASELCLVIDNLERIKNAIRKQAELIKVEREREDEKREICWKRYKSN